MMWVVGVASGGLGGCVPDSSEVAPGDQNMNGVEAKTGYDASGYLLKWLDPNKLPTSRSTTDFQSVQASLCGCGRAVFADMLEPTDSYTCWTAAHCVSKLESVDAALLPQVAAIGFGETKRNADGTYDARELFPVTRVLLSPEWFNGSASKEVKPHDLALVMFAPQTNSSSQPKIPAAAEITLRHPTEPLAIVGYGSPTVGARNLGIFLPVSIESWRQNPWKQRIHGWPDTSFKSGPGDSGSLTYIHRSDPLNCEKSGADESIGIVMGAYNPQTTYTVDSIIPFAAEEQFSRCALSKIHLPIPADVFEDTVCSRYAKSIAALHLMVRQAASSPNHPLYDLSGYDLTPWGSAGSRKFKPYQPVQPAHAKAWIKNFFGYNPIWVLSQELKFRVFLHLFSGVVSVSVHVDAYYAQRKSEENMGEDFDNKLVTRADVADFIYYMLSHPDALKALQDAGAKPLTVPQQEEVSDVSSRAFAPAALRLSENKPCFCDSFIQNNHGGAVFNPNFPVR